MTRVAILGDTHFGVRGNSPVFYKHFNRFYSEIFFPALDDRGISDIIQVGDLLDKRTSIDFQTYDCMKKSFIYPMLFRDICAIFLVGNHDAYWKHSNSLNGIDSLFADWKEERIVTYSEPQDLLLDDTQICLLPWINDQNMSQAMKVIDNSKAFIAIGHLEIFGFEMHKGMPTTHGLDPKTFEKFQLTLSGHFHHKSSKNGIHYLGTPYEMTWMDWNDPKGFHILDLETRELEYIVNPNKIFHKIVYSSELDLETIPNLESCFVQVYIKEKKDIAKYQQFLDAMDLMQPADVSIIEETISVSEETLEDLEIKTTLDVLTESVDKLDTQKSKDRIKHLLGDIYKEAIDTSNEVLQ